MSDWKWNIQRLVRGLSVSSSLFQWRRQSKEIASLRDQLADSFRIRLSQQDYIAHLEQELQNAGDRPDSVSRV